jgi:transcriptional regulator with XRE-family HTH domain
MMSGNQKSYGGAFPLLGDQIRQWRLVRKLTQAGLEQAAGLSHNTVSRIECGSVSPTNRHH